MFTTVFIRLIQVVRHVSTGTRIGFIGAGNMATSMMEGLLNSNKIQANQISAYDMDLTKTKELQDRLKIRVSTSPEGVVQDCDMITLAVKPCHMPDLLYKISQERFQGKFVVSVAAGLYLSSYEKVLPKQTKVARIMPNLAVAINQGTIGLTVNKAVGDTDRLKLKSLLELIAPVICEVNEEQLDAITSLSGSGIAIGFVLLDALTDAGITVGLTAEEALTIARQTIMGSLSLQKANNLHPAVLKSKVCSAGGTTIYALNQLEHSEFRSCLIKAVIAGKERSEQLK